MSLQSFTRDFTLTHIFPETMGTMVSADERDGHAELTSKSKVPTPYVNHVATLTGGVGYDDLARFYKVCMPFMVRDSELTS